MCGAQSRCPGAAAADLEHLRGLLERRRDRLLDEHVLARLERRPRQPAVLGHAREHHDDVDVRVRADRGVGRQVGAQAEPLGRRQPLRRVGVVDRDDLDAALAAQPLDQGHVRRPEDAPAADDAQPHAHVGAPRGLVVRVGPGRLVDVVARGDREHRGERRGRGQRGDHRQPRVGRRARGEAQRRRAGGGAQAQRLVAVRVALRDRARPSGARARARTSPTSRPRASRRPRPGCARPP